jgi:hypothetical protein
MQGNTPRDPSPEDIRRECQLLRERWSERELRRRAAWYYEEQPVTLDTVADLRHVVEKSSGIGST